MARNPIRPLVPRCNTRCPAGLGDPDRHGRYRKMKAQPLPEMGVAKVAQVDAPLTKGIQGRRHRRLPRSAGLSRSRVSGTIRG